MYKDRETEFFLLSCIEKLYNISHQFVITKIQSCTFSNGTKLTNKFPVYKKKKAFLLHISIVQFSNVIFSLREICLADWSFYWITPENSLQASIAMQSYCILPSKIWKSPSQGWMTDLFVCPNSLKDINPIAKMSLNCPWLSLMGFLFKRVVGVPDTVKRLPCPLKTYTDKRVR